MYFLLGVLVIASLLNRNNVITQNSSSNYQKRIVQIGNNYIEVEIADNLEKGQLGLGKRNSLAENSGMLFTYSKKTIPGFWMKDMFFPIDIVWIDDEKIVDIDTDVPNLPSDTPLYELPIYSPSVPVNYVLEVNAGFIRKNNIKIGDSIVIK